MLLLEIGQLTSPIRLVTWRNFQYFFGFQGFLSWNLLQNDIQNGLSLGVEFFHVFNDVLVVDKGHSANQRIISCCGNGREGPQQERQRRTDVSSFHVCIKLFDNFHR